MPSLASTANSVVMGASVLEQKMHHPVMTERQLAFHWKIRLKTLRRWRLDGKFSYAVNTGTTCAAHAARRASVCMLWVRWSMMRPMKRPSTRAAEWSKV